jgi:hypothetical protein
METEVMGEPDPETGLVRLEVCASHPTRQITACVGELAVSEMVWDDVDPGEGQLAGIGHNNPTTGTPSHGGALFDYFNFGELRIQGTVCMGCFCSCEDQEIIPVQLHGTFMHCTPDGSESFARMECLCGLASWEMNRTGILTSPIWSGSVEITTAEYPPVLQRVTFTLVCTPDWQLDIVVDEWNGSSWVNVDPCACFTGSTYPINQSVTARMTNEDPPLPRTDYTSGCDPISLVYGPWNPTVRDDCNWCYAFNQPLVPCLMNGGDPLGGPVCEGEFWIVITE